jgi:predicted  nucleic acid-binding Zn-ribbon protein
MKRKTRHPDAKLLRFEAEFNAASDRWNEATDRTEALEAELEETISRLRSRLAKAEKKEEKKAAAFARALDRIMKTRAKSLEGLLVKVRARERDYTDDEDLEVEILKSLVDDIKAITGAAS